MVAPTDFGLHVFDESTSPGTWKRIDRIFVKSSGIWKEVWKVSHRVAGVWKTSHYPVHRLIISTNQTDYNVLSQIGDLGSPMNPVFVYVTINSGVTLSGSAGAAFQSGALPAGSAIHITNNGYIYGKGGNGGDGGDVSNYTCNGVANGGDGGDAIDTQCDLTIDNDAGYIFGGGGGGGGGGGSSNGTGGGNADLTMGGGGGAGGRGPNSTGGGAGSASGAVGIGNYPGSAGSAGSTAAAGSPGTTDSALVPTYFPNVYSGGSGGDWGVAGGNGDTADSYGDTNCIHTGGAGGAAGKAIELNGNSVSWEAGNNASQVKGAVS